MRLHRSLASALLLGLGACQSPSPTDEPTSPPAPSNPAAEGFRAAESDPEAVALADATMEALGGRAAWDRARYLSWNFFGFRTHVWDKHTGRARLEHGNSVRLFNVNTGEGRVWADGVEVTDPVELRNSLGGSMSAWINDCYWLVMPYKLKDSGVRLRHLGPGTTEEGAPSQVLELTFEEVGDTPQNKYHVWVEDQGQRVTQWAFFAEASMETPGFVGPYAGWEWHGDVALGGDRGARQLTEIHVYDELPDAVFESPEPFDPNAFPSRPIRPLDPAHPRTDPIGEGPIEESTLGEGADPSGKD